MPFLIKSSGGQRTCQLMTNKDQSSTREDIVEALKGLTFKFEVKIVDVVSSGSDGNQYNNDVETEKVAVSSNGAPTPAVPALQVKPRESTDSTFAAPRAALEQPTPVVVEKKIEPPAVRIENPDPVRPLLKAEEVPKMIPRCLEMKATGDINAFNRPEEPKKMPEVEQVESRAKCENTQPKTLMMDNHSLGGDAIPAKITASQQNSNIPLIKGAMKVGSIVTTCCVSMDESVNPPTVFVTYNNEKLLDITKLIMDISQDIEDQSEVGQLDCGDIIFAKSQDDDSWYRAIVEKVDIPNTMVYFFDWGIRENLSIRRVRRMSQPGLGLSQYPACASKVKFTNEKGSLLEEALKCEGEFNMRIESYDDTTETYTATIVST